jgi:Domain of Unknown Function (DUF349)
MTLLDRFRTQPQKHPDPAVRLAYVEELPLSEHEQIVAAAREDEDPRVRRAAVGKLMDPGVLAAIAREDADPGVREHALVMLRDIALDAFEGVSEATGLAAVDALDETRILAQIAKTSLRESVGRQALTRLDRTGGSHILAAVARQAVLEPIRQSALDQLHDRADILVVALNSDYKDAAASAVERLVDRDDLEQVASRARSKVAAKRARQVLRERDEREAQESAAAQAAEAAAANAAAAEAARLAEEQRLRVAEEAAKAAEEARVLAAAQALERSEEEARETAERATREAEERQIREADEQRAREAAEQAASEETARRRQAEEAEARTRREGLSRMNQLIGRVEALVGKEELTLKAADRALRDVRDALADVPPLPSRKDYEDVVRRLKAVSVALTPKVQDLREVSEWQRWANVGIQEQLCEKMEALRNEADPEAIARRIHDLQQQWRLAADVPRPQGEALWRRFKTAHDELWVRCEAHFATQAEQRADNLAKKSALCERVEALADSSNWVQTAEEIKGLQAQWKAIGPVTRGQEKAIWERFRAACDRFFTRRQDDLVKRKAMWAENFGRKEALCLKVEALAESTDWEQTASAIRALQAEWKTIGPVKKSRSDAIWQRFRAACDKFFTRYAHRHDVARAERIAAREAICVELEALVPLTAGTAEDDGAAQAIEPPPDLAATVRTLRNRWQQELAARGVDRDTAVVLDRRYAEACRRVITRWPTGFKGTDLDPEANRRRLETLVKRVEELASSLGGGSSEPNAEMSPQRLASMLKEALAANTIGGKVDVESRRRAAQEEARQAQATWSRIGHVADDERRTLADRFQRALKQIAGH